MKKISFLTVGIAVISLIVGLIGGYWYEKSSVSRLANSSDQFPGGRAQQGFRSANSRAGGFAAGGAISRQVISKDDTSLTIKTRDGSSKIILITGNTTVAKSAAGLISDIATDAMVMVLGNLNSDGSITANSIQIRPEMPNAKNP
jgi:hypothetical protein